MNTAIRNIIFDLGGVILNLDIPRTEKAFQKLGMPDPGAIYSHNKQTGLFDKFDKGLISPAEFRNELRRLLGADVSDEAIDNAWNAMLLDLPGERLRLLAQLKNQYRIFLLSNTNEIHMIAYGQYLQHTYGFRDLSHIFIKQYLSYQVGMRKPGAEIFRLVLEENDLQPSQTLFIDDTAGHVEGARSCGIQGLWLQGGNTIINLFDHHGKLK